MSTVRSGTGGPAVTGARGAEFGGSGAFGGAVDSRECPEAYQGSPTSRIPCGHPLGHPPLEDGSGRYWAHGRGSMHWGRMADYQPPTVDTVTVPLAALRALVEKTRELDESISDDRAMTQAERAPFEAEISALVTALGVEGL